MLPAKVSADIPTDAPISRPISALSQLSDPFQIEGMEDASIKSPTTSPTSNSAHWSPSPEHSPSPLSEVKEIIPRDTTRDTTLESLLNKYSKFHMILTDATQY